MEINILIEEGINVNVEMDWLQRVIEKVLVAENLSSNVEISLLLTGQERIQELNREYRGKDQPTDVLSFSLSEEKEEPEPAAFIEPPDGLKHLGEVIISYPQAIIQAEEHGHTSKKEIVILIIHGVLHILGYDHEKPELESIMEARENALLAEIEGEML